MRLFRRAIGKAYRTIRDRYYALRFLSLKRKLRSSQNSLSFPNQLFRDVKGWYWFWLNTVGYRKSSVLRQILPNLPDIDKQVRFTGSSGDNSLREAFAAYSLFKQLAEASVGKPHSLNGILDFGCGWGRTIRFFLKDIDASKLWGVDALPEVIEICKHTNKWCNFEAINPMPPTAFREEMFDLIYCYSVFSHLSEEAHWKWLLEFKRILKPNGLFIATTRPRKFILQCAEIRKMSNIPPQSQGVSQSFLDTEKSLSEYDSGLFCHSPTGGGDILSTSFYGETCIPKAYVLKRWIEHFTFLDFIPATGLIPQNVIVVKK